MSRKIIPKIEDSIWVLFYHLVDLLKTYFHSSIELFYKCRIQDFITDPGSKYKGQPREVLPSLPQVIYEWRNLSLLQCPVTDHDTGRRAPDLFPEVRARIQQQRVCFPIFFQQQPGQLNRGPALVIQQNCRNLFQRYLAEQTHRGNWAVASDTIISIDMIFPHLRDNSHRY